MALIWMRVLKTGTRYFDLGECSKILEVFYTGKKLFLYRELRVWVWRRQWQPTPVLLPGKSHGRRSLVACSPWGREEWDTVERLPFHFSLSCTGEGNGNPFPSWRIPGTVESGGLPSMGSHRVGHDWSDLAAAAWKIKNFRFLPHIFLYCLKFSHRSKIIFIITKH